MRFETMTRWQAAPIHLALSVVIATAVMGTMLLLWYPRPFFEAAGGATLVFLLVGVDVVLGPLLTFIIFDVRKKYLFVDLAVIAMLQAGALTYGVSIMFNARPVYLAYAVDRFQLVSANEISPADLEQAAPGFRTLPLTGPKVVGALMPDADKDRAFVGIATMMGGGPGLFPQHYVPYATVAASAVARSRPLAELRMRNPARAAEIDAVAASSGRADADLRYLPLQTRRGTLAAVVDTPSGALQGFVFVDPW